METSLKTGFAQIFSCCPKNLSRPKFGGAAAPLAPPARTPMLSAVVNYQHTGARLTCATLFLFLPHLTSYVIYVKKLNSLEYVFL